jgi:hypothetical protein
MILICYVYLQYMHLVADDGFTIPLRMKETR